MNRLPEVLQMFVRVLTLRILVDYREFGSAGGSVVYRWLVIGSEIKAKFVVIERFKWVFICLTRPSRLFTNDFITCVYMVSIGSELGRENLSEIHISKGPRYYSSKITHLFNYSRSNSIFPSWLSDHKCQHGGRFQIFSQLDQVLTITSGKCIARPGRTKAIRQTKRIPYYLQLINNSWAN